MVARSFHTRQRLSRSGVVNQWRLRIYSRASTGGFPAGEEGSGALGGGFVGGGQGVDFLGAVVDLGVA